MFPYYLGGFYNASGVTPLVPFAFGSDMLNDRLPDEVKAAIEERKDEIHSEDDLRRIAHEEMKKR